MDFLGYVLLSVVVHFAGIFGYSICSAVIPPMMDYQPCDAVFLCCFQRLETAVLEIGEHQTPKALALTHVCFFSSRAPLTAGKSATRFPVQLRPTACGAGSAQPED